MTANIRLLLIIVGVVAIGGAAWHVVNLIAAGRVTKATETYNQENRDAADRAMDARARVRACYDGGGVWNRQAGQCERPLPPARQ